MEEEPQQIKKEPQGEAAQEQQITKQPHQVMKEPQGEAAQVQRVTTRTQRK